LNRRRLEKEKKNREFEVGIDIMNDHSWNKKLAKGSLEG